eukprot:UN01049
MSYVASTVLRAVDRAQLIVNRNSQLDVGQATFRLFQMSLGCWLLYATVFNGSAFGASTTQKNQFRETWKTQNPHWKDDPYFTYHPNVLRMAKKSDFDVIATRPAYHAVKQLREAKGLSLQPPYNILPPDQRAQPIIELERDQEWDL